MVQGMAIDVIKDKLNETTELTSEMVHRANIGRNDAIACPPIIDVFDNAWPGPCSSLPYAEEIMRTPERNPNYCVAEFPPEPIPAGWILPKGRLKAVPEADVAIKP
jgi:hypothetical protein